MLDLLRSWGADEVWETPSGYGARLFHEQLIVGIVATRTSLILTTGITLRAPFVFEMYTHPTFVDWLLWRSNRIGALMLRGTNAQAIQRLAESNTVQRLADVEGALRLSLRAGPGVESICQLEAKRIEAIDSVRPALEIFGEAVDIVRDHDRGAMSEVDYQIEVFNRIPTYTISFRGIEIEPASLRSLALTRLSQHADVRVVQLLEDELLHLLVEREPEQRAIDAVLDGLAQQHEEHLLPRLPSYLALTYVVRDENHRPIEKQLDRWVRRQFVKFGEIQLVEALADAVRFRRTESLVALPRWAQNLVAEGLRAIVRSSNVVTYRVSAACALADINAGQALDEVRRLYLDLPQRVDRAEKTRLWEALQTLETVSPLPRAARPTTRSRDRLPRVVADELDATDLPKSVPETEGETGLEVARSDIDGAGDAQVEPEEME